jgi:uncharacterized protein
MGEPVSQYVLKIHGRCDLACDHCYVYEHADHTWRDKPRVISPETVSATARRITESIAAHGLSRVSVVLHGGEPLLVGKSRMRELLSTLTTLITPTADLDLRVHSNGVRLDEQWCALFSQYGVRIGISLDGDQTANDRHRRFADGHSSYHRVLTALQLLRRPEYRHIYGGILCTIDVRNDPIAVYQALAAQEPPNLDLLLPHATWANPPNRPAIRDTVYADWLMRVHDRWDAGGRRIPIRIFDSILSAAHGGPSFTEALGTDPADLLVIDTDGAWEQPDSMKTAFDGAAATGMNVFDHSADSAARHPAIAARQRGTDALCATCRACSVVEVCGGGLYAHRYRPALSPGAAEFKNPSVYCSDLKELIRQVTAADPGRSGTVLTVTEGRPDESAERALRPGSRLSDTAFDGMAAGAGDAETFAELANRRLSNTRLLIAEVGRTAMEGTWRDEGLRAAAAAGWDLLCALDRAHPQAVADVLAYPYAFAWARRCLRPPLGADSDLDRAHLASLAAAASLRACVPAQIRVPVRRGLMHVPTAGAVAVDARHASTEVLAIIPGRWPTTPGGTWRPTRRVVASPFTGLVMEDLDPFRDCQEWPVSGRLSATEWQAWRRCLIAAGRHLAEVVPSYARVLGIGLRAIVPLRQPKTAGDDLAEVLLHEFQHLKLTMLLDQYRLVNPGYQRRLLVPWRDEPRPAAGALRGTYAYLAVTHLHGNQGGAGRMAYLRHRSWVCQAADALLAASGALTPDGRRFVAGVATAAGSTID